MAPPARFLTNRWADGWLLGGVGVAAWVLLYFGGGSGSITGWAVWIFAGIAAAHFGASYHLAYAGGWRSLREHPVALVVVPAALVITAMVTVALLPLGSGATTRNLLQILVRLVFTLTGWHYIKQAFGVAMLALRSHGATVTPGEATALRYCLYPIWFFQATYIYENGIRLSYRQVSYSMDLIPHGARLVIGAAGLAGAFVAIAVMAQISKRQHRFPPAGLWATYLAGALWLLAPPSFISAGLVLSALHGLQYLAVAHRAEVDGAVERGETDIPGWWLCVFGGAMAGGLILTSFLPGILDRHVMVASAPGVYATLLFVALNLHHYAIDAVIWRSRGEHVRRVVYGPAVSEPQSGMVLVTGSY